MTSAPLFFIVGPTGSGKTRIAVEVAARCNGEVIGADAFQIYKGMEILTSQPSKNELARVPHHLVGSVPLEAAFDVAKYRQAALGCALEIRSRGKVPIVAGGTGLYVRALTHGLAELPPADPAIRADLETRPLAELEERLRQLDPVGAASIDLKNRRRLVRGLEVCVVTGKPFSSFRQQWEETPDGMGGVLLNWPRQELHERIASRTRAMFDAGLLEEVAALPVLGPTASQVLGLEEARACIAGSLSISQAIEAIELATRQYAKRQITWFRKDPVTESVELGLDCDMEQIVEQTAARARAHFHDRH